VLLSVGRADADGLPDTVRWSVPIEAPLGAPVLAGSTIAVPLRAGTVVGHRLSDGQRIWTSQLSAEQSLASDADHVYVASGEVVHALNAPTGTVAWRAAGTGKVTAPPLAHSGWVIAAIAGELLALRAADGNVVWRKTVGPVEFRPAIDGDLLVVSLVEGRVLALNLQDGSERWTATVDAEPTEPFAIGERVYVGTIAKTFVTFFADSGRLESKRKIGALTKGRAVADDRHIYFAAMDNLLWATNRGNGAIEWTKPLPYRPAGGPVLLNDIVLAPSYVASLPLFAARTGDKAGELRFPARLAMLPLFTRTADGTESIIAITGENDWTLSMRVPSPVPALTAQPLTELPGVPVLLTVPRLSN
jgi:outer membrane protein assembly factor BamB